MRGEHRLVTRGRQPDLRLLVQNRKQPLRGLAHDLLDDWPRLQRCSKQLAAAPGLQQHCMFYAGALINPKSLRRLRWLMLFASTAATLNLLTRCPINTSETFRLRC